MNNFVLGPLDTDSISIAESDMSSMSKERQNSLVEELNSLYPEKIKWAHDGYFHTVIVLKTKNYILWDGKKLKIKGSALKSAKTEPALKAFMNDIIWSIIKEEHNYQEIYHRYIKEALNVQDIKRWAGKKSISEKVLSSDRLNESKIRDAIAGTEYSEGDKVYCFFREDESLCLVENFTGEYDKMVLVEKVFKVAQVFKNIMNTKELFLNYSLKRNKKLLENV